MTPPNSKTTSLTLPKGISARGDSITLDFRYRGKRCRETLRGIRPTKANIKFAERKRQAILHEIAQGSFDYARHFPNSPNAARFSDNLADYKTVGQMLDDWLRIAKARVTAHTYGGYERSANQIRKAFGDMPLSRLTRSDILTWMAEDLADYAPTTIAAYLLPLSGLVRLAMDDRILAHDPTRGVRPPEADDEEPDPLTKNEINAVLAVDFHRRSEMNAAKFAIWSGVRTGELLALAWEDIDWINGTVRIQRALTRQGYRVPKTKKSLRTVELLTPALEALQDQRALSEMQPLREIDVLQRDNRRSRTEQVRFIFHNSLTGEPFTDPSVYRDGFWRTLLRKAKVRFRGPSRTRHTFISQMLTAGMPKEWIIRQVGHASADMIDKHYGKWITEDALNMAAIANEKFAFGHMTVTSKTSDPKTGT